MEKAKEVNLGFSTADGEDVEFSYKEGSVTLQFTDWTENRIKKKFFDVIAVKWQDADSSGPEERDDMSYEIVNSEWLNMHIEQNMVAKDAGCTHYKLCFNACGIFEILCTNAAEKT